MMTAARRGLVTAVTELRDGRLVMIVDVEKILAEMTGYGQDPDFFNDIEEVGRSDFTVLYADDSGVARDQISRTLKQMGLPSLEARNGAQAWSKLNDLADQAEQRGQEVTALVRCIITDVEMPEMDGYVLTQKIKEDERFKGIPVIMHSSLSAEANRSLGTAVGADLYVPKFHPQELADAINGVSPLRAAEPDLINRHRFFNPEALGVIHPESFQHREDFIVFHELGDG